MKSKDLITIILLFGVISALIIYFSNSEESNDENVAEKGKYFLAHVVKKNTTGNLGGNYVVLKIINGNDSIYFEDHVSNKRFKKLFINQKVVVRAIVSDTLNWLLFEWELTSKIEPCISSIKQPNNGWDTLPRCPNID